jgi:hypothetical protein
MNVNITQLEEAVFVSKLRRTDTLEHGRIRQIFDVVNLPGLQVVCISKTDEASGEISLVSQEYKLASGVTFTSIDEAVVAWDNLKPDLDLLDALGEALVRYSHGLMRPLWCHRTPAQKEPWLARARQFKQLADSLGLSIEKVSRQ